MAVTKSGWLLWLMPLNPASSIFDLHLQLSILRFYFLEHGFYMLQAPILECFEDVCAH